MVNGDATRAMVAARATGMAGLLEPNGLEQIESVVCSTDCKSVSSPTILWRSRGDPATKAL